MRINILLALLGFATITSANASNIECKKADAKEIAALFDRWNSALQSGNPEKVADNYASQSILLPTLSNTPRLSRDAKVDYFKHFQARKPIGKIDSRMINIGCNSATDTGLYTFTYADGESAHARYSYAYNWDGKNWLISSHHSSLMPEQAAAQ